MEAWRALRFKNRYRDRRAIKNVLKPRVHTWDGTDQRIVFGDRRKMNNDMTQSQAGKVIAKFGGVLRLYWAMKKVGCERNYTSIYRWTYPWPKGRGGQIPPSAWEHIDLAARSEGIELTDDDRRLTQLIRHDERIHGSGKLKRESTHGNALVEKMRRRYDDPRGKK